MKLVESLLVYLDVHMNVSIKFVHVNLVDSVIICSKVNYMFLMCIMLPLKLILDEFDMNDKSIDIVY
ncbi:hypothetical protein ES288_D04G015700v1 [Gossypium darwinii]|uniref:Uncharacterized protein n=1 Tax=Gossypium darwinii TaxID=34276 RepID=A0A5D2CVX0_GOSDA|nr:hypothetical protein ES288_D04G015700v1 [Gossypium darwinii]